MKAICNLGEMHDMHRDLLHNLKHLFAVAGVSPAPGQKSESRGRYRRSKAVRTLNQRQVAGGSFSAAGIGSCLVRIILPVWHRRPASSRGQNPQ